MANLNYNKVFLCGHISSDTELKQTQNGTAVTTFSLAVSRKDENKTTDFIECVAWKNNAEFVSKYFQKGSSIFVEGEINVRSWDTQDGQKRYKTEVIVRQAYFVDSKSDGSSRQEPMREEKPTETYPEYKQQTMKPEPNFEYVPQDDDLPL